MNVLFLMKVFEVGGQEVVTTVLANSFVKNNHHVVIASFKRPNDMMVKRADNRIVFETIGKFEISNRNVDKLRQILINEKIDIIVNQWGLPFIPISVIKRAKKGLPVKVISVYHNQIDTNAKIMKVEQSIRLADNNISKFFLKFKLKAVRRITSLSMRYVYNNSDIYEVLSPCYIELFKKFTGIKNPHKLRVQTNPITIQEQVYTQDYDSSLKEKEIIYVGRLDFVQKRVYRVIDTWNFLEEDFPDWRLTIVGDGEDRDNLEEHVRKLGLKNVTFEGFKNPVDYYKRASVLILTSDFEGFPLVLAECMSFGVVPIVYNSYAAVGDIITDGKDGIVVPASPEGYKADVAAHMLTKIMKDDSLRNEMAMAAIEKSKNYSVDEIYNRWMKILMSLYNEKT